MRDQASLCRSHSFFLPGSFYLPGSLILLPTHFHIPLFPHAHEVHALRQPPRSRLLRRVALSACPQTPPMPPSSCQSGRSVLLRLLRRNNFVKCELGKGVGRVEGRKECVLIEEASVELLKLLLLLLVGHRRRGIEGSNLRERIEISRDGGVVLGLIRSELRNGRAGRGL